MIDPKSAVIGAVVVLVLGAGTWSVSRIDSDAEVSAEQTALVVVSESPTATPSSEVKLTPSVTPTPKSEVANLTLSAVAKSDGVHLSWKSYTGNDFEYGKVVRSETNPNLRYPDDGYILYYQEQSKAAFVDATAKTGVSYYYRICVKQKTGAVVCGNVVHLKASTAVETPKETPKSGFTSVTGKLALTAVEGSDSIALSWSAWPITEGFNYYKVVRSQSNANPYYPNDGYISVISDRGALSFTDSEPKLGTSYYRICAVADQVYCGNVVTISR